MKKTRFFFYPWRSVISKTNQMYNIISIVSRRKLWIWYFFTPREQFYFENKLYVLYNINKIDFIFKKSQIFIFCYDGILFWIFQVLHLRLELSPFLLRRKTFSNLNLIVTHIQHMHTHIHEYTHTITYSLPYSLIHSNTLSLCYRDTLRHTLLLLFIPTLTLSITLNRTNSLTHSLHLLTHTNPLTHTHTSIHSNSNTDTHSFTLTNRHSNTLTRSLTLIPLLTLTHIHTH